MKHKCCCSPPWLPLAGSGRSSLGANAERRSAGLRPGSWRTATATANSSRWPRSSAWSCRRPSGPITAETLAGARLLYLRAPSTEFTDAEAAAVVAFVKGGGSLLLVLDEERRQSLDKTKVNNLISPFGMKLTPDTEYLHNNGAVAKTGEINKADRQVPFSGGRAVEGGTPFAYQLDKDGKPSHPFGAYSRLDTRWPHRRAR